MNKFTEISTIDDLDDKNEVLVYKHSTSCPVSLRAMKEVQDFLESNESNIPVVLIDVFSQRRLSQEIATAIDLRHESPQIILLKEGKVLWSESHFKVTSPNILQALTSD